MKSQMNGARIPPPQDFAERINKFRQEHNLSMGLFATLVGVGPLTVFQWETGMRIPQPSKWAKVRPVLEGEIPLPDFESFNKKKKKSNEGVAKLWDRSDAPAAELRAPGRFRKKKQEGGMLENLLRTRLPNQVVVTTVSRQRAHQIIRKYNLDGLKTYTAVTGEVVVYHRDEMSPPPPVQSGGLPKWVHQIKMMNKKDPLPPPVHLGGVTRFLKALRVGDRLLLPKEWETVNTLKAQMGRCGIETAGYMTKDGRVCVVVEKSTGQKRNRSKA